MTESHWNRQGRASGGYRPARFNLPNLCAADLEILKQEALIRSEFGEYGVKRFWESLPAESDERCTCWQDDPRTYEQRVRACPVHGESQVTRWHMTDNEYRFVSAAIKRVGERREDGEK